MPKTPSRRTLSPAALVFALLVLATVAAFAVAQRLKRDPLVLDRTTFGTQEQHHAFSPNGDCVNDRIRIRFRTTTSDHGKVQIVEPGGRLVKTLAREASLARYRFHTYYWDGIEGGGGPAPAGRYKLRVTLIGQDRVLVAPGTIHLHRVPPHRPPRQRQRICATAVPRDQGSGAGRGRSQGGGA